MFSIGFLWAVALVIVCFKAPACNICFDNPSIIIGALSILVTVLVGGNICNAIEVNKTVRKLEAKIDEQKNQTNLDLEKQKKEIEQENNALNSDLDFNIMHVFLHIKEYVYPYPNKNNNYNNYISYYIIYYGLSSQLYEQKSKRHDKEYHTLKIVIKVLRDHQLTLTSDLLHNLLFIYDKLEISDAEINKELKELLLNINISK